jgi:hypothetical protein
MGATLAAFVRVVARAVGCGIEVPRGATLTIVRSVRAGPVGREQELATLHEFLSAAGSRGLVLTGGPGIGKTTLWEAAVGGAREGGIHVLSTRASGAEAQLSFAALIDLLDEVDLRGLKGPSTLSP